MNSIRCPFFMCSLPGIVLSPPHQTMPIPNDGTGRILITDIGYDINSSLRCSSFDLGSQGGNWYFHPTMKSIHVSNRIMSSDTPDHGWYSDGDDYALKLWRDPVITAEEGVFTCRIVGAGNSPASVGIYYNSESLTTVGIYIC